MAICFAMLENDLKPPVFLPHYRWEYFVILALYLSYNFHTSPSSWLPRTLKAVIVVVVVIEAGA